MHVYISSNIMLVASCPLPSFLLMLLSTELGYLRTGCVGGEVQRVCHPVSHSHLERFRSEKIFAPSNPPATFTLDTHTHDQQAQVSGTQRRQRGEAHTPHISTTRALECFNPCTLLLLACTGSLSEPELYGDPQQGAWACAGVCWIGKVEVQALWECMRKGGTSTTGTGASAVWHV